MIWQAEQIEKSYRHKVLSGLSLAVGKNEIGWSGRMRANCFLTGVAIRNIPTARLFTGRSRWCFSIPAKR